MNTVFKDELGIYVFVYIDDIFIYSNTKKEHDEHVRSVCRKLRKFKFYSNREKSQYLPMELQVLGHLVTRRGISPIHQSVTNILQWPIPQNRSQLQSFLGMVNYFSRFMPHLVSLAAPLTEMAGATATWDWTPTHTTSFEKVKLDLSAEPAIKPIDYNKLEPIYLVTDASLIGRGAWIGQGTSPSTIISAGFHVRKFNPAQENYSTFDKELLAIKDGSEAFRSELLGCSFTILTDHKPLVAFPMQYNLSDRQERSQRIIYQFDCRILYLEGKANVIADAFSRVFINPSLVPTPSDFIPSSVDSSLPPQFSRSPKSFPSSFSFNPTPSSSSPNDSAPPDSPRTNHLPTIMTAATTTRSQAKDKSPAAPRASPAPPADPTPPRLTYAQVVHAPVAPQVAERERQVEAVLIRIAETIPYQSTLPAYNSNEPESINTAIYR